MLFDRLYTHANIKGQTICIYSNSIISNHVNFICFTAGTIICHIFYISQVCCVWVYSLGQSHNVTINTRLGLRSRSTLPILWIISSLLKEINLVHKGSLWSQSKWGIRLSSHRNLDSMNYAFLNLIFKPFKPNYFWIAQMFLAMYEEPDKVYAIKFIQFSR